MNNNNNLFWQKIKLNLFCLNDNRNRRKKSKKSEKASKHCISIILGKLIWIIIEKIIDNFF